MTDDIHQIVLPLRQAPLLVLIPLLAAGAVLVGLKRMVRKKESPGEDPDWSAPSMGDTATGNSLIHRWDVRCKIITIVVYSFAIASLHRMGPALAAVGVSLAILTAARVSIRKVLLRLLAISGFIGMLLIIMPLTAPVRGGDTVYTFAGLSWLALNTRGFWLAVIIAAKACAITLLMEPLLSTAPLPVTLHGLSRLGAPEMVGQMVLLSYRYLHVFRHEARRMACGMQVRGFRKQTNMVTLRTMGNFLGMLFVRSYERTERVFDAMRARGYRGRFPAPSEDRRLKTRDVLLAAGWLIVGALLIVFDRSVG